MVFTENEEYCQLWDLCLFLVLHNIMPIMLHILAGHLAAKFLKHFTVTLHLLCLWNRKEVQKL
jgi:hypothetical protein